MTLKDRFFKKVTKTNTCWIWNASGRGNGYGCIKINHKVVDAHRVSWNIHFGDIPKNKIVCHICDVKKCVNPSHLFLGTYKDNLEDDIRKHGKRKLSPEGLLKKQSLKSSQRKLSPIQVLEIRDKKQFLSYRKLGKLYGVDEKVVRLIISRKEYKEV